MNKREIKVRVKEIKKSIITFRNQLEDLYEPVNRIVSKLEEIEEMQNEHGLDTGIDFESATRELIVSFLENNEEYNSIEDEINALIDDIECWKEDLSESKQELVDEEYISVLEEIRANIDTTYVCDKDTLDDMLFDVLNSINESGLI